MKIYLVYFTNTGDTVFTSSVLYVDDVSYSTVSGISQYIMNDVKVNVYPKLLPIFVIQLKQISIHSTES